MNISLSMWWQQANWGAQGDLQIQLALLLPTKHREPFWPTNITTGAAQFQFCSHTNVTHPWAAVTLPCCFMLYGGQENWVPNKSLGDSLMKWCLLFSHAYDLDWQGRVSRLDTQWWKSCHSYKKWKMYVKKKHCKRVFFFFTCSNLPYIGCLIDKMS